MVSRLDGGQGLVYTYRQGVVGCARAGGGWIFAREVQGYIEAGTPPLGLTAGLAGGRGTTERAACTGLTLGWPVNAWRAG